MRFIGHCNFWPISTSWRNCCSIAFNWMSGTVICHPLGLNRALESICKRHSMDKCNRFGNMCRAMPSARKTRVSHFICCDVRTSAANCPIANRTHVPMHIRVQLIFAIYTYGKCMPHSFWPFRIIKMSFHLALQFQFNSPIKYGTGYGNAQCTWRSGINWLRPHTTCKFHFVWFRLKLWKWFNSLRRSQQSSESSHVNQYMELFAVITLSSYQNNKWLLIFAEYIKWIDGRCN